MHVAATPGFLALAAAGAWAQKMCWTDAAAFRIRRADLDGTGVEDVLTTASRPAGIALDSTAVRLYRGERRLTGVVRRATLNGTAVEVLLTTSRDIPFALALDPGRGHLHWTEGRGDFIGFADLDCANLELLVAAAGEPVGLALDLPWGRAAGRCGDGDGAGATILDA